MIHIVGATLNVFGGNNPGHASKIISFLRVYFMTSNRPTPPVLIYIRCYSQPSLNFSIICAHEKKFFYTSFLQTQLLVHG